MANKLSEEFERRIAQKFSSKKEFAEMLNVPPATLRTWLSRDRFPKQMAEKMAALLKWEVTAEEMECDYGAKWAHEHHALTLATGPPCQTLREAFRRLDRQRDQLLPALNRLSRNVGDLNQAAGVNDLFVFASATVTPLEFEKHRGAKLAIDLASGIARGVTVLYLRPTEEVINMYRDAGFRRILEEENFTTEIEDFRSNVLRYLHEVEKRPEAEAKELARTHVVQYRTRHSLFFMPGFTIGMLQHLDENNDIIRRMTVRLPHDFGGILYLPEGDNLFAWRFGRLVDLALDEEQERLKDEKDRVAGLKKGKGKTQAENDLQTDGEILSRLRNMMEARFSME